MKAHKRNKVRHAFRQGYKAGMRGRSEEQCPYSTVVAERGAWLGGWREGRDHYLSGYLDIEGI